MKRGPKNIRTRAKNKHPQETSSRGTRARAVERAERLLLRRASPRLLMSLLLLLTGGAGFLCSYALLRAGLSPMWLRYPVAILSAYCVFLLLLRLWLGAQGRRRDSRFDLDPSVLDFVPGGGAGGGAAQGFSFGGAGDFGGGGAGGEWVRLGDAGAADADPIPGVPSPGLTSPGLTSPTVTSAGFAGAGGSGSGGTTSGGGLLDSLNIDLNLDLDGEGCAVLLALAALAAAAVAGLAVSVYVVYAAPALLAEILVDGLLVAGLYKRMKHVERRHWLRAAVRKTCLPVALTVASFSLAGYAMQRAVPRARTVGEFWRYVTSD